MVPSLCRQTATIEINTVEVIINNSPLVIFGIYRPHSDSIDNFVQCLYPILSNQFISNKSSLIMGDLNINLCLNSANVDNFSNSLRSFHFVPLITKPTRFDSSGLSPPSVLDQIWYNKLDLHESGIVLHDLTDHLPTFITIPILNPLIPNQKIKIRFRLYDQCGIDKFDKFMEDFDWNCIKSSDPNTYAKKFELKLNEFYRLSFSAKTKFVSPEHYCNPWMTKQLRRLVSAKSQYFAWYRDGFVTKVENNIFKNKVNSIIKSAKVNYHKNLFDRNRSNLRATWYHIKNFTSCGQNKSQSPGVKLLVDGEELLSPKDVCEAFNAHFCSIGARLESQLPSSSVDPLSFISHINPESLYLSPVTPLECCDFLSSLKNTKQDFDVISVKIIKIFKLKISLILSDIVNCCFESGVFPNMYKEAIAIALYKNKGSLFDVLNYRSISLLLTFSKIIEKCLYSRLSKFAADHNILAHQQFGFRKGLSTKHAVSAFCEHVYDSLNKKYHTVNIFIDLQKAYDTIYRNILLSKLEKYGIRGLPLRLISSFFFLTGLRWCVWGILIQKN